jgi:hypothetical protein
LRIGRAGRDQCDGRAYQRGRCAARYDPVIGLTTVQQGISSTGITT